MSRRWDIIGSIAATGSTFVTSVVSVTSTSPVKIPTTNLSNRKAIMIRNCSSGDKLYLGGSGVTTANGFWLNPNETLPFDMSEGAQLYGIADTGITIEVRTIEIDNG